MKFVDGKMRGKNLFWINLKFIFLKWIQWDRSGTFFAFLRIPITVLLPILNAFLLQILARAVELNWSFPYFVKVLLLLLCIILILTVVQRLLESKLKEFQTCISMHYAVEMMGKLIHMDYERLENYDSRAQFQRCKKFAFEGRQTDGAWAIVRLTGLLTSLLGIASYSALFGRINIILLVVILGTCLIEWLISSRIIQVGDRTENEMVKGEMEFTYLYRIATRPEIEKDIRLSRAASWLIEHLKQAESKYMNVMHTYTVQATKLTGMQVLCTIIRDFSTFYFLVASVLNGNIMASEFLFYFSLVTGFSDWINGISGHIKSLKRIMLECEHYRDFINIPNTHKEGKNIKIQRIETIECKNVSFGYTEDNEILKDINICIHAGQNIALVGVNGAGKTTLIKLLCGLYQPTKGEILINGVSLQELDLEDYYSHISAVFQDYMILPTSVYDNITFGEEISRESIKEIENDIGVSIQKKALLLSGGQKQKLLLARALYKRSSLLVLDEPTAAMDSIAEERLYQQYKKLAEDRISIFISHRLSSTQFCDTILLMEDGKIVEEGTHETLMNKNGLYKEMFDKQGFYYRRQ